MLELLLVALITGWMCAFWSSSLQALLQLCNLSVKEPDLALFFKLPWTKYLFSNLYFFPDFQLLKLLWTAVLIALKQEVFRSMVFMLLWHHGDNRNRYLPPWKNSALCPTLKVAVCLQVPIFRPIWSNSKVEWDCFLVILGESSSPREVVHTPSEYPRY